MTDPQAIAIEHLWWNEANDRYYVWEGASHAPDATSLSLVSLAGTRITVPRALLQDAEVSYEVAEETLASVAHSTFEEMSAALHALDPSLGDLSELDLTKHATGEDAATMLKRLVAGVQERPDVLSSLVAQLERVQRFATFGSIGASLRARFAEPRASEPPESANAMVARVRQSVRAELDALSAQRPPMNFDDIFKKRPS